MIVFSIAFLKVHILNKININQNFRKDTLTCINTTFLCEIKYVKNYRTRKKPKNCFKTITFIYSTTFWYILNFSMFHYIITIHSNHFSSSSLSFTTSVFATKIKDSHWRYLLKISRTHFNFSVTVISFWYIRTVQHL